MAAKISWVPSTFLTVILSPTVFFQNSCAQEFYMVGFRVYGKNLYSTAKNTLAVTFDFIRYFFHLRSIVSKSPWQLVVKDGSQSSNWLFRFYGEKSDLGVFYGKNTLSVTFWLHPLFFHLRSIVSKSPWKLVVKDGSQSSIWLFRFWRQKWVKRLRRFWPRYYRVRQFPILFVLNFFSEFTSFICPGLSR